MKPKQLEFQTRQQSSPQSFSPPPPPSTCPLLPAPSNLLLLHLSLVSGWWTEHTATVWKNVCLYKIRQHYVIIILVWVQQLLRCNRNSSGTLNSPTLSWKKSIKYAKYSTKCLANSVDRIITNVVSQSFIRSPNSIRREVEVEGGGGSDGGWGGVRGGEK